MMGEIAKLVGSNPKGTGYLDESASNRTVETLMGGSSDPRHRQEAGRRLDPLGDRQGAGDVSRRWRTIKGKPRPARPGFSS